ncbi:Oidioi.mRNA.OKI2018_I69.XSR.g15656.t1.cds [Oikopleura dioica]|uniref:Oidioi.mRNA.OKI2018_I69.XSR.g15656.t1.cds n=1 Tax=Oikopleura dioica TaxID=34765 RepID=A0ABN7SKY4_OIKDI|nr:Oidioi.mRNA.OKI2018_I69.XSR.g15656.t1.cds [Oikopleura dioica]
MAYISGKAKTALLAYSLIVALNSSLISVLYLLPILINVSFVIKFLLNRSIGFKSTANWLQERLKWILNISPEPNTFHPI